MRRVLIVGGGSQLQPRLRKVGGIETVVICRASVLNWVHELAENRAVLLLRDDSDSEDWVRSARGLHDQWHFDTVASLAEIDQEKAALIAVELALPFHAPETVQYAHDKQAMRDRLAEAGVEHVPHRLVADFRQLRAWFDEVGGPLVLKPSRGRASAGVAVARTVEDLERAFACASGARAPRLEPSPVLAERYYDGPEYSVESLTHEGHHYVFAVTDKRKDDLSKVELGHVVPAELDAQAEDDILSHVRTALTALGVLDGISHTEVILAPDGPVIVETHLRIGGDEIPFLVHTATGVDMTDLFLRQLAGEDIGRSPEIQAREQRPVYVAGAAIRYLAPDRKGVLDGVDGWDDVAALDGVQDSAQELANGTLLGSLTSSYSRIGHVRVQAPTAAEADALATRALGLLRVRIRADEAS